MPESPEGTYVANNLAVLVNGRVNGTYPTGPGQVVDGNLYWSMNPGEDGSLLSDYATVPDFAAATGLERDGLGEVAGRGTDPRNSPAIGAGIAIPRHPRLGRLPDTRSSRDIGALPDGASPAELRGFPFDPDAATQ